MKPLNISQPSPKTTNFLITLTYLDEEEIASLLHETAGENQLSCNNARTIIIIEKPLAAPAVWKVLALVLAALVLLFAIQSKSRLPS